MFPSPLIAKILHNPEISRWHKTAEQHAHFRGKLRPADEK